MSVFMAFGNLCLREISRRGGGGETCGVKCLAAWHEWREVIWVQWRRVREITAPRSREGEIEICSISIVVVMFNVMAR